MGDEISLDRKRNARAASPSLRDVMAVLFRQCKLLVISFAVVFFSVLFYLLLANSYQAEMKVLVRRGRLDPPMAPQPTAVSEFSRIEVTEEEINSEVELLRNPDILRRIVVADQLAVPAKHFWNRNEAEEVRIARAVRRLAQRLHVEPVRKTRLIAVRYDDSDPIVAARTLRSLAEAYREKHVQSQRPSGEFAFFQQQKEQYGKDLEDAEGQLLALIDNKGVVSAALQRDLALQKLSEADATYRQNAVAIAETEQRVHDLRAQIVALPERSITVIRASDNPQLLEQLKSTLLNLELKRTALLTKFEPGYRLVQEVDQQIKDTKKAIAVEIEQPVRDETTDKNANYEWAKAELQKAEVELGALRARATASASLLAGYRGLVKQLGQDSLRQQTLLRTAKAAEDSYLLYLRKREEARIGDALDQRGILNVTLVQEPVVPALPNHSLGMIILFGFLLASTLSTSLAFASDYLDPGFRTPAEVSAFLDAPVLASLPQQRAATEWRTSGGGRS
jgi:uncharacterized protein involved in exopolysaccharide biosynthesis